MKNKKNYHRLFVSVVVVLLLLTVVIFNTTSGYWKALSFIPLFVICFLGIWKNQKEEKEEEKEKTFLRIRQYYQYPKK